jgi:hypothetical protein
MSILFDAKLQLSSFCLHSANALFLLSYFMHRVLLLRAVNAIATFSLGVYFYLQPSPAWSAVAWSCVFLLVNGYQIVALLMKRFPNE